MRTFAMILAGIGLAVSLPGWAGTATIDFSDGVGLLTGQSPANGLKSSGGRALFSNATTAVLKNNGSYVMASGTISITMVLSPYSDAQYGVGLIMVDTSDTGNTLTATADGDGNVVLSGWMENQTSSYFTWPSAGNNSMTLTYDTYADRATLTCTNESAVSLDMALGASSVYVGVGSLGPGGFGSFTATGTGIPDYPVVTPVIPNNITRSPQGFIEEGMSLSMTAPDGSGYQWKREGSTLSDDAHRNGTSTQTMTLDPVEAADAGSYTCVYSTTAKTVKETEPYVLVVYAVGSVPMAGTAGIALLAGLVALGGAAALRAGRKRRCRS